MSTDETFLLKYTHVSMQFSDTKAEKERDAKKIMSRGRHIVAGTEAGPGSGDLADILRDEAEKNDYRFFIPKAPTDAWIAVQESLIEGNWDTDYFPIIPGSSALPGSVGKWGPKGLVTVAFDNAELGRMNFGCAHYLTGAREPGVASQHGKQNHWDWNMKLARRIGEWAEEVGKGSALAFYSGDQNMADARNDQAQGDTFFGERLTSAWDELKKWEGTGHGPIDVIASYDGDGRVKAKSINAFNDRELFLHTDHFLVDAVFEIRKLKAK